MKASHCESVFLWIVCVHVWSVPAWFLLNVMKWFTVHLADKEYKLSRCVRRCVTSGKLSFVITRSRKNYPVISGKRRKLNRYHGKMEEIKYMNAWASVATAKKKKKKEKISSFEPDLNQRPKDFSTVPLQSSALPTELSKGWKLLTLILCVETEPEHRSNACGAYWC